jgi:hypothetical protein
VQGIVRRLDVVPYLEEGESGGVCVDLLSSAE